MNLSHETILSVNLNLLEKNFLFFKKRLNPETKIIGVVKAYAYGYGDIEISRRLEKIGVDALWVADFEEGVNLRSAGITIPIMVANPGFKSYNYFLDYKLEPVIYSFELLNIFAKKTTPFNIHIKFNTGMNRYGFNSKDLPRLLAKLNQAKHLKVKSICSHLATSNLFRTYSYKYRNPYPVNHKNYIDENKRKTSFMISQLHKFNTICNEFVEKTAVKPMRHILNSEGVLHSFHSQEFSPSDTDDPKIKEVLQVNPVLNMELDMVRIGIGLYGSAQLENQLFDDTLRKLIQIGSLESIVTQVQYVKKNDCIGYNAGFESKDDMEIAIIPFGYADGLNRKLGNRVGGMFINNTLCEIIGEISMDSCFIDVTNKNIKVGDKVEIFGENIKVNSIANQINTIPYEILSVLNRRIKRVYLNK